MSARACLAAAALALAAAACASNIPNEAAEPRRPKPLKVVDAPHEDFGPPPDCEAADPTKGPASVAYKARSIPEGENFAKQGVALLRQAEEPGRKLAEQHTLIEDSVQKFFLALSADPYNALATYNLAAAYARIGRRQCSLNLLARLAELSTLPSHKAGVEEVADRLFGRGKSWKGKPDPDFDELRTDETFRSIVKGL